jgi:hypothetical protein
MARANGNITIQRGMLSDDPLRATDQTVATMMKVAEGPFGMRSPKIRALAINIVRSAGVAEKDYYGEILAVHEWVKNNIRYMRDPVNQETISHPEELAFNSKAGDCDDMTVLEIALLGSIGVRAWPVVVGVTPGMPSHVYLRAQVPAGKHRMAGKIINLDPIMKEWQAGREAPAHRIKIHHDYRDGNYMQGIQRQGGTMSGMDDLGSAHSMLPGMGSYVSADSYLDTEDSHAQQLLKPDLSLTTGSIANSPKVTATMEGIDGMFGGMGSAVVEQVGIDTPMEARNSLQQLGPKGPLTALSARLSTRPLASVEPRPIGAKVYEVPTVAAALAQRRGKPATTAVGRNQTVVTVATEASQSARTPKTAREEANEINGLLGILGEIQTSFLPGLGSLGEEERQQIAERSAVAGWWAGFKARAAAARSAWFGEQARQARMQRFHMVEQNAKVQQAQEHANAQAALQAAQAAHSINQTMARQDPELAQVIAETNQALDNAGDEAAGIDGLLGLSADDISVAAQRNRRRSFVRPSRAGRPMIVEEQKTSISPQEREALLVARRGQVVKAKAERLQAVAQRGRKRGWFRGRRRGQIMAPVQVTAYRDPEQQGRTAVPAQASGMKMGLNHQYQKQAKEREAMTQRALMAQSISNAATPAAPAAWWANIQLSVEQQQALNHQYQKQAKEREAMSQRALMAQSISNAATQGLSPYTAPQPVEGLAGLSLTSPWVLAAAGLGLVYFLRKK